MVSIQDKLNFRVLKALLLPPKNYKKIQKTPSYERFSNMISTWGRFILHGSEEEC